MVNTKNSWRQNMLSNLANTSTCHLSCKRQYIKEHHCHSCLNAGTIVPTVHIRWWYVNNSYLMKNLWSAFLLVVVRMSKTNFWCSITSCQFFWSLLYCRKQLNWPLVVECSPWWLQCERKLCILNTQTEWENKYKKKYVGPNKKSLN